MKLRILTGVMILSGSVCLGQQFGSPTTALDKAGFEEFLGKVQAAAELWAKDDPNDPLAEAHKTAAYTSQSVPLLKAASGGLRGDAAVFVAAKLVAPLLNSDSGTITEALPIVKSLHTRLARYRDLPKFPAGMLRTLKLPDKPPGGSAEGSLRAMATFSERRNKKIEAEAKVIHHNVQALELEQVCIRLLLKANQPNEDLRVVEHLAKLEKEGQSTYQNVLDAIKLEAPTMSADRAGKMYDFLLALGKRLEMTDSNCMDPTNAVILTDQNSRFFHGPRFPGMDILAVVNVLAPVAHKPTITLPTMEEVLATSSLNHIKARLAHGRGYSRAAARRDLQDIITRYPKTNGAKQARALLEELTRRR
ncbi:MAG TPA: hypothetical protein VNA25_30735 [Phycisphaerae bacterium]|nr:hypothetical protein [Phycisphaerae bacterium]